MNKSGCPVGIKKRQGKKCVPDTKGEIYTKSFKNTNERDTFIKKYFPDRKPTEIPGTYVFKIPGKNTGNQRLYVEMNQIWWHTGLNPNHQYDWMNPFTEKPEVDAPVNRQKPLF